MSHGDILWAEHSIRLNKCLQCVLHTSICEYGYLAIVVAPSESWPTGEHIRLPHGSSCSLLFCLDEHALNAVQPCLDLIGIICLKKFHSFKQIFSFACGMLSLEICEIDGSHKCRTLGMAIIFEIETRCLP